MGGAKAVVKRWGGTLPASPEELGTLPGLGPYTARAEAAFAFDLPAVFIETNIRTVFIHFLFPDVEKVHDPAERACRRCGLIVH